MRNDLTRYSSIHEKNKREIVMLRGTGCKWKKCRFCDYHLDFSKDEEANTKLNAEVLANVTGFYGKLEVINSGSFFELNEDTIENIENVCKLRSINELNFESHWMYKDKVQAFRERFKKLGINLKMKIGVESFDYDFRELYLVKGMKVHSPEQIGAIFDEVCLLQGLEGQTVESMRQDISIGLRCFDRICINIMIDNGMPVKPSREVVEDFVREIYPIYKYNERVDILLNNTDFGVG